MNDDRLFGPRVDHDSNSGGSGDGPEQNGVTQFATSPLNGNHTMDPEKKDSPTVDKGEPQRLSIELPRELQGVERPRKKSSWFTEMCLGRETSTKLNDMELSTYTPSSSISGPAGKSAPRGGGGGGVGGVGSRLRASIFSVLGKLGMSILGRQQCIEQ